MEEYVDVLKKYDVNVSGFINKCMEIYIEILTSSRTDLMERQKHTQKEIEDKKFELKLILQGLLSEYQLKIHDGFDDSIYKDYIDNKGMVNDKDLNTLIKLTGLRKSQLTRLSIYLNNYEKYNRDDYNNFRESVDYLIQRFNEDNSAEMPLNRDGGYL